MNSSRYTALHRPRASALQVCCAALALAGCAEGSGVGDTYGRDGGPRRDGGVVTRDAGPSERVDGGVMPRVDGGPGGSMTCNDVAFRYVDASARSVWISGSWLGWAATVEAGALQMVRGEGGAWTLTTHVPSGSQQYKLIVDGTRWMADPSSAGRVPDGFGGENSTLEVCAATCDPAQFDWRDAVMYFVLADRFRDSDGMRDAVSGVSEGDARTGPSGQYAGGDLPGVIEKLPYLSNLGMSAIWLSAPYENRNVAGAAIDRGSDPHTYSGYHGYWPSPANVDYSNPRMPSPTPRVESRIGSSEDLHRLVDTAHATHDARGRGMKVLFDYVMKHVDTESGLYSAHSDWFARRDGRFALCGPENLWDDAYWGTRCAFTDYLAPFDFENPAPRTWSVNDAVWWAREYGIDGFRLDAIKHVPLSWLTELRTRLRSEITMPAGDRFYLVGETFAYDDTGLLARFVDPATKLDGQFDFPFKARLCEAVFRPEGRLDSFAGWMAENDGRYGPGAIMSTWIGNHDIPRAIHFASREIGDCRQGSNVGNGWSGGFRQPTDATPYERLGVAFAVMMTNPGVPLVYYGDEIGLAGGGDPDNRRMMPWDDASLLAPQRALRTALSRLAAVRAEHVALSRGRRTTLSADQDTWVFRMSGCTDEVVVAINRADSPRSVTIPDGTFDELIASGTIVGGRRDLPARSYLLLAPRH